MWRLSKVAGHRLARHNRDVEGTVSSAWNRELSLTLAQTIQGEARDTRVES